MKRIKVSIPYTMVATTEGGYFPIEDAGIALENRAMAVFAIHGLESDCEMILEHMFRPEGVESKLIFKEWLIESNILMLESKKKLILALNQKLKWLEGNEKKQFEESFAKVIRLRNAFTHGHMEMHYTKIVLQYFNGGPQEMVLNDELWTNTENYISEVSGYLGVIKGKIFPTAI